MRASIVKRAATAAAAVAAVALGIAALVPLLRAEPARAGSSLDDRALEQQRVALGKRLFFDTHLSRDGKVSCATCHRPELAFTDGRPVAVGFEGKAGRRNSMSLLNVGGQTSFFWDGRRARLEDQVLDPLTDPLEHALADPAQVLQALRAEADYATAFRQAFPGPATAEPVQTPKLAAALAEFVRSLKSPQSAIDRFLVLKDRTALSADARAGFDVFSGKGQCATCHSLAPEQASGRVLLTDQKFHAHSAAFYGMHQALDQLAEQTLRQGRPLADVRRDSAQSVDSLGRFMVTGQRADVGAFRTPSLRNVARTGPYFHDGRVATLELAIEQELLIDGGEQILLTPEDKRVLLAFLRALDDDR